MEILELRSILLPIQGETSAHAFIYHFPPSYLQDVEQHEETLLDSNASTTSKHQGYIEKTGKERGHAADGFQ